MNPFRNRPWRKTRTFRMKALNKWWRKTTKYLLRHSWKRRRRRKRTQKVNDGVGLENEDVVDQVLRGSSSVGDEERPGENIVFRSLTPPAHSVTGEITCSSSSPSHTAGATCFHPFFSNPPSALASSENEEEVSIYSASIGCIYIQHPLWLGPHEILNGALHQPWHPIPWH